MNDWQLDKYIVVKNEQRSFAFSVEATVVIITYNSGGAILDLINSLKKQTFSQFEIIVVDNGKTESQTVERITADSILYIKSNRNSLPLGRNIGTTYARGNIIVFLDDDCIAHNELLEAHVLSYRDPAVLGVRGRALPKRLPIYSHFQSHYDLGRIINPAVIDLEGNSSFKKCILTELGGFDHELFGAKGGAEGLELSYRIIQKHTQLNSLIYNPAAIIYHDFAKGFFDYIEKCYRHPKMRKRLVRQYPRIFKFAKKYGPYDIPKKSYSSLIEKILVRVIYSFGRTAEIIGSYS